MKRPLIGVLALLSLAGVWFFALQVEDAPPALGSDHSLPPPPPRASDTIAVAKDSKDSAPPSLELLDLAKDLNSPGRTIRDDLRLLDGVFAVYQTNFLKDGNPVGENSEITAALTGHNALHLAFIAPDHPAINTKGELCDRWGTPFFFHQQSRSKMEIRSAGPDRVRGNLDDVLFTP